MDEAFFNRDDEDRNIYHPTRFAKATNPDKTLP
jgi:hypothetical protein